MASALAGIAVNAARPHGVSLKSFAPPTECGSQTAAQPVEMAPREAQGLCGQPGVIIADTRADNAFAEGHVAGAVHLPCSAGRATEVLAQFDGATTIVVYGQSSDDARPVAESLLRRHPNARVAVLKGGFAAWSQAGLACASGQ
jgi:rhodanese-related sulfurtransferase